MLTDHQKFAFFLHSCLFFYIYPVPLGLNKAHTRLIISRSPIKWTLLVILIANVLFHSILYSFVAVRYGWWAPRPDFTWLNILIILSGLFILLLHLIAIYTCIRQHSDILGATNSLLQISANLSALAKVQNLRLKYNHDSETHKIFDRAMIGFVIFGAFAPFVLVFAASYTGYDALNFILDDVISTPKMYWNQRTLYLVMVLRACSVFITWLEVSRSGTYFGCCTLIAMDHSMRVVGLLMNNFIRDNEIFTIVFKRLQITFSRIRKWSDGLILLGTLVAFWGTVAASWFSIRCFGQVDWTIYCTSVGVTLTLILTNFVLIPALVKTSLSIMRMVKTHYKVMRLIQGFTKVKSRRSLYNLKRVKALKPIVFWCGTICVIDQAFLVNHLWMVVNRTVDAILIIDVPKFS